MKRLVLPLVMVCVLAALPVPIPTGAQEAAPEPGICDGAICGPSGAFSVPSFPTLTDITWEAFPANPARPYTGERALWVAADGSDSNDGSEAAPLASINYAVEIAQPGDVIWVRDGTYPLGDPDEYEGVILATPGITLAAEHVGAVTLVPAPGDDLPAVGIQAQADDLVIDGFVVQGFRSVGIEFGRGDSQRNLVLKHLRVEQTEEGIRAGYVGDGSQAVIDGLLLYDVWLRDIQFIGSQCGEGPCDNMRFEALRIDMSAAEAGDTAADALAVESGQNVVVFNAEITGASGDGIDLKSSRNAVANVVVGDLGRNGIKLWQGGDVINALVYNTGADAAIVFEAGDSYRVLNTIVARHSRGASAYAMTVAYDSPGEPGRLEIINSVFYQNSGAIWVSPDFELDVRNSIFFGSANGEELIWDPVLVGEDQSPISALGAAGTDNLGFVDPLFANPDAGDFSWGADSPMLDAGAEIDGLPEFDLTGGPRVSGAGVDLGPWELE
jgi:hypothetical protein